MDASLSDDFLIGARIESLIAASSEEMFRDAFDDALRRAETYTRAGVDVIMIHSKTRKPDPVLAFADAYDSLCSKLGKRPWLMCVPTIYNEITDSELAKRGFNIVIHANHLLRSAYKAMWKTAKLILSTDRSFEADQRITPLKTLFEAVSPRGK